MGQFDYTRAPSSGPNRFASLDLSGAKNLRLRGLVRTVLRMLGDGGQGTWYLINVRNAAKASGLVYDLDSTGPSTRKEQTHTVQIGGTVSRVTGMQIDRVRFWHPALPVAKGWRLHSLVGLR